MVEELARCGVREAVISPGSRSTPLALALWREPAIEARVIVDERSAGFFALGAAQATGRPTAVLCTSGTAAANLHPAVCEADESAVGLIVLTADRPPELRGIGAGQTIDQLKLYGSAVRWFCEVGTHDADDAGLLHFRSVACRAFWTAAGDPRPGPVHLNVPWRDPLGPEPRAGDVTASAPLALEGRGRTAADHGAAGAAALPADGARRGARRARARVAARADPRRAPARRLGVAGDRRARPRRRAFRSSPSPPRSSASAPTTAASSSPPTRRSPAAARPSSTPDLILRFGEHADLQAAAPVASRARRRARSSSSTRATAGTSRAGSPARSSARDPEPLARAVAAELEGAPADESLGELMAGSRSARSRGASPRSSRASPSPRSPGCRRRSGSSTPTASSSTRPRACRSATRRPSSRPARPRCSSSPTAAPTGSTGSSRPGSAPRRPAGARRSSSPATSACSTTSAGWRPWREATAPVRIVVVANGGGGIFDFLPQASQLGEAEFEALLDHPARPRSRRRPRASSAYLTGGSRRSANSARRSPPAPA